MSIVTSRPQYISNSQNMLQTDVNAFERKSNDEIIIRRPIDVCLRYAIAYQVYRHIQHLYCHMQGGI